MNIAEVRNHFRDLILHELGKMYRVAHETLNSNDIHNDDKLLEMEVITEIYKIISNEQHPTEMDIPDEIVNAYIMLENYKTILSIRQRKALMTDSIFMEIMDRVLQDIFISVFNDDSNK